LIAALTLVARIVLAAVFAIAGVSKLRDRSGTRTAVVSFGAPERVAGALALALPAAELTVAGLLLPASTASYGALGALILLGLFTVTIAWNLAHGRRLDCRCFGQLHSSPAGWRTVWRNVFLAGIATLTLVGSTVTEPASALAWISDLSGAALLAVVVAAAAVAVLAVGGIAFLSLMRSYGKVLNRLDRVEAALAAAGLSVDGETELSEVGLAPGTPTPFFAATAVDGEEVSSESIAATGLPTLLLFTSPSCGPCAGLMPTVASWQREHADRLSVVVASSGSVQEVREEAAHHGLERVLHDGDRRLSELFQANGTPSAVVLAPDGTVASWMASGSEWIEQLVGQVLMIGNEGGLPVGALAPDVELPSLDGESVSLASLRGRDTVLLFWNSGCGFCREMRDDVIAWEASSNGIHPRLVVVTSGTADDVREEGFSSLVLLDADYMAGDAFEANGTPMAVRLDADGRVASPLVAGAHAVLALARQPIGS
jgi:thiol-disulfide isomerase/thioredoxin